MGQSENQSFALGITTDKCITCRSMEHFLGSIHTVLTSARDLQSWPLVFRVLVVNPRYRATPDTPSKAATDLISVIKQKFNIIFITRVVRQ